MYLTKIKMMNILLEKAMLFTNILCTKTIKVELIIKNNVINSCTVNSRHISIRYFFVNDCVNEEEFRNKYCNTLTMIVDLFTRPLQRSFLGFSGE